MDSQESSAAAEPYESAYRPLRIWPAVLLLCVLAVSRSIPTLVDDLTDQILKGTFFGLLGSQALLILWWLLASRATWRERIVGGVGLAAIVAVTIALLHDSMFGPGMILIVIPAGLAAFTIGAILFSRQLSFRRTIVALLLAAVTCGPTTLLRSDGMWGNFALGLHWRFTPSAEDEFVAEQNKSESDGLAQLQSSEVAAALVAPEWPAFRGANRDGRQSGVEIETNWNSHPPEQLWKTRVGPGWSSFAVAGYLLFTQEQRGPNEAVVCYGATTGNQLWIYEQESRFSDPLGGPGPRATPTLAEGGLFAMGANGLLTRLNLTTGEVVWQKDLREEANREPPEWGFSSSPLVIEGVVIVHAGGGESKGTLAFDVESGDLRWSAPAGDHSYSSPQPITIDQQQYVLMLTNDGMNILDPATGKEYLDYQWPIDSYRALQPQAFEESHLLIPSGIGVGLRRIQLTKADDTLVAEDLWTSLHLDPDFNDFVVFENHAYGFDGAIFACVNLDDGKRSWKKGRYGKGQVLLLADSGVLLIVSETGEIVLLQADPEGHKKLAEISVLEGKTWNHPVVVGDRLYVRNSQEAACYRLPTVSVPEATQLSQFDR